MHKMPQILILLIFWIMVVCVEGKIMVFNTVTNGVGGAETDPIFTSSWCYNIDLTNTSQWNSAGAGSSDGNYNTTSIQVTGSTTKTLNLEQDGQSNLTATWTDIDNVGYNSLSDLQSSVSNDFHNLGGVDATGITNPFTEDIDAGGVWSITNLYYITIYDTATLYTEHYGGRSEYFDNTDVPNKYATIGVNGLVLDTYLYADTTQFKYNGSEVCTQGNDYCPDTDTYNSTEDIQAAEADTIAINMLKDTNNTQDTRLDALENTNATLITNLLTSNGTLTTSINGRTLNATNTVICTGTDKLFGVTIRNGVLNATCQTDATGAGAGTQTSWINWTSQDYNTTAVVTTNMLNLTINLSANSIYLINCQFLTRSTAVGIGERINVTIVGTPKNFNMMYKTAVSATTISSFEQSSTSQNLFADTGGAGANLSSTSFLQGIIETNAVTSTLKYGLYSETAANFVEVSKGSWCRYDKVR